ncbi:cytosine deaminase-like metal-dependent hydrolase [Mycobacterium sp. JS623]|uniref:amidohydrolase family protein n=1 Tax=Mycobacterium sp. JS623 TaxID=212767 RepID=UPI0002A55E9B|nr:amidohydrolase family protein [Mycobacterium sp. JS623]AGB25779.1 cytosine deaminase-like metal-dependent hydrolase [Mycobacterium sp. JS623]
MTRPLLLSNANVLTMDDNIGDLARGDVLIENGEISRVGVDLDANADADVLDCADKIVLPGFVNSHLHMFQTALRAYWCDAVAEDYFTQSRTGRDGIFHQYTPEDVYWGELGGALENLSAGTTTVVDTSQCSYTPEHSDAALDAIRRSGIRCVFSFTPVFGHEPAPTYNYPNDIRRLTEATDKSDDRVSLALGYLVDANDFRLARELDLPVFAHINNEWFGRTLEELDGEGLLGLRNTYIHCLGLNDSTWQAIARTGGKVSLSCFVEHALGMGRPAIQRVLDYGIPSGLGTDAASLGPVDMFTQMRAAFQSARQADTNPARPATTRDILRMATLGGAQAAHLDHRIGSLTPGKIADIVVLNARTLNTVPVLHASGAVVHHMDTSNVDTVIVGGDIVKSHGRLHNGEVEATLNGLTKSAESLLSRSRE